MDDDSSDDSLSEGLKASRRNYLKDEINALERTLGKRRGQLKNADRLLKTCNTDLMDAREQVTSISISKNSFRLKFLYPTAVFTTLKKMLISGF